MKKILDHIDTYWFLYLGIIIQAAFYLSASKAGWLDVFFSNGALHNGYKGIDFY